VVVGIVTRDSGTQPVLEYFASEKNRALSMGWVPELQAQFFFFFSFWRNFTSKMIEHPTLPQRFFYWQKFRRKEKFKN